MTVKIEPASIRDLDVLAKIERESFTVEAYTRWQLAFLLLSPGTIGFVARKDAETVGFIIGMKEKSGRETVGHIITIDVSPKHRRTGVGLQILDRLEQEFLAQGVTTVYLEVRVDNQAARRLYAKEGYSELEPLENYYDKGKHGLRMKKTLK